MKHKHTLHQLLASADGRDLRKSRTRIAPAWFLALILPAVAFADGALTIAPTLSDAMVVQRDQPIVLWGTASPGATVVATLADETVQQDTAADGTWLLTLKARPANTRGQSIRVTSGDSSITLDDVLIGDVWFCAGQSNMFMKVGASDGQELAGKHPGDDQIRFLNLHRKPITAPIVGELADSLKPTPENKRDFYRIGKWQACGTHAKDLSAVAYWFAHHVQKETRVPIGLIVPAVGGSATQAWVSRAAIQSDPAFRPILDSWIDDQAPGPRKQMMAWAEANPGATFEQTPLHHHRPACLFETAVEPMRRHAITGVLWYQGEYNADSEVQMKWNRMAFPALINSFRDNWKQPRLPFYSVQLPGYGKGRSWPEFREQHRQLAAKTNTHFAVTIDLGDATDIHPKDKPPIGHRLALLALAGVYGMDLVASSPAPVTVRHHKGDGVSIRFSSIGTGLKTDGEEIPGFELVGPDGVFKKAVARLATQDTVELRADGVPEPKQVRYAWAPMPRPLSLANSADLPAGPFVEPVHE